MPTLYAGTVNASGELTLRGQLRFIDADGTCCRMEWQPEDYASYIGESSLRLLSQGALLRAPRLCLRDVPRGAVRADQCSRTLRNSEGRRWRRLSSIGSSEGRHTLIPLPLRPAHRAVTRLERIGNLAADPQILETHVRATAGVNALEGVGMVEAPRGVLIHHYKVDENGAITWANLIVASGHNNLAIGRAYTGERAFCARQPPAGRDANRVSAVVRLPPLLQLRNSR